MNNIHQGSNELQLLSSAQSIMLTNTINDFTLQHPFTMMVTGPSGSGKTHWTKRMFLSNLINATQKPLKR